MHTYQFSYLLPAREWRRARRVPRAGDTLLG